MQLEPSVCEEQVYRRIYRTHAKSLRNYLYYKFGDMEQAEDAVQESFLRVWKKCKEILYSKVQGFLFKIATNLVIDDLRSKKIALKFEKNIKPDIDTKDPYFVLRTKEFQTKIETVISALPEKQREAFLMNRIDKMTFKEISIALEISQTAVEKRIAKALLKLKEVTEIEIYKI